LASRFSTVEKIIITSAFVVLLFLIILLFSRNVIAGFIGLGMAMITLIPFIIEIFKINDVVRLGIYGLVSLILPMWIEIKIWKEPALSFVSTWLLGPYSSFYVNMKNNLFRIDFGIITLAWIAFGLILIGIILLITKRTLIIGTSLLIGIGILLVILTFPLTSSFGTIGIILILIGVLLFIIKQLSKISSSLISIGCLILTFNFFIMLINFEGYILIPIGIFYILSVGIRGLTIMPILTPPITPKIPEIKTPKIIHEKEYTKIEETISKPSILSIEASKLYANEWGKIVVKAKGKGKASINLEGDVDWIKPELKELAGESIIEIPVKPKVSGEVPVKVIIDTPYGKDTSTVFLKVERKEVKIPVKVKKIISKKVPGFPDELISKYEPLEFLGEGGFAKVFKVKRRSDGKIIALKVLKSEEKTSEILINEVTAWLSLEHENIIKLYGVSKDPIPHLENELAEGIMINNKIVRDLDGLPKPVDEKIAIKLIRDIAEGLKYAHSKKIFHRDLKPQNILLSSDFKPKITDWGLAKVKATSSSAGMKAVTLMYAAPEQLDSKQYGSTDQRTDIFQLGLVFYELLTGRLPFEIESPYQVMSSILDPKPFPPVSKFNVSLSKFDGLISRMLAKRKEERYQNIEEFISALNMLEIKTFEIEVLRKDIISSFDGLKKSRTSEEVKRYKRLIVENIVKLALICGEIGDLINQRNALHDLKSFAGENISKLEDMIKQLDYCIENNIKPSDDFNNKLKLLLHEIKRGSEEV
jgi:serine/threonine protein kinase